MKRYLTVVFSAILLLAGCSNSTRTLSDLYPSLHDFNVLLISLDTLRADRLGIYGNDKPVSPFMDQLSRRSVVCADVFAQSPSTRTSHRAIFTSRYVFRQKQGRPDPAITMAGILSNAGWETAAFTDGGLMHHRFGNDAGFKLYDDEGGGFARIIEKGEKWMQEHQKDRFFLFLHTYDIHYPYIHPKPYDDLLVPSGTPDFDLDAREGHGYYNKLALTPIRRAFIAGRYEGGIRYCDAKLMQLMAFLKDTGLHDKTIVIILSDHGESLGERNYVGHNLLYDVQLKVPMILYFPDTKGFVLGGPVETVDLLPTLLHFLGVDSIPGFMGLDLATRMMLRHPVPTPRTRLSENLNHAIRREDGWKLIIRDSPDKDELFNCDSDPEETNNLISQKPEKADHLFDVFEEFTGTKKELAHEMENPNLIDMLLFSTKDSDKKLMEQLQNLGYVH